MKTILFLTISLMTLVAFGRGPGEGGGGDEVGLQFQNYMREALNDVRTQMPELNKVLQKYNLEAVIEKSRVIVVEDDLNIQAKDYTQNSVAANFPSKGAILVNRPRWNGIESEALQKGLAFHETLSLHGLESTGKYPFSTKYLRHLGVRPETFSAALGNIDFNAFDRAKQQIESRRKKETSTVFSDKLNEFCTSPKFNTTARLTMLTNLIMYAPNRRTIEALLDVQRTLAAELQAQIDASGGIGSSAPSTPVETSNEASDADILIAALCGKK